MRKHGIEVTIIDANAEIIDGDIVADRVRGMDMVFITSSTLDKWVCPNTDLTPFLATVNALKSTVDKRVVVGVHGTVTPEYILDETDAWAVVSGEPEQTMVDLASGQPRNDIAGIVFRENGVTIKTSERKLMDVSELPPPSMDLLSIERYRYEILGSRLMILETSRGCPHGCRFCLRAMYGGRTYRRKKPEQIRKEIHSAVYDHGVKSIYFMDIEFTIDKPLALAVCDIMSELENNVVWCCQTRADSLDNELVTRMSETGCKLVHFGVESGNDRVLTSIGKGESTEQIFNGVRMVREAGMETACFFMFGFPGETVSEMKDTISFAISLKPTYASFHVLEPYPGTPMADDLSDYVSGAFPIQYDHPSIDLRGIQRQALMKFYLRPSYILQRLKKGRWNLISQQVRILADYLR